MKKITINKKEIDKFSKLAEEWWDPNGKFKPLHNFNPVRLKYIKDSILKKYKNTDNKHPLKNIRILDIGCGGGLLCEPLSKLGAEVVGIDASEKNIKIAKLHSRENNLRINYFCASPENFKIKGKFDVILNMEIVEHVENVNFFLNQSTKFLKKKGLMFVATLNKTLKSFFFAIIGAEYILRWLPIGTHDWDMFIEPKKLINICKNNNLVLQDLFGVKYNLINNDWEVSKDTSINYLAKFEKY
jgi:2-polyprenyl-6-hydroxyphenyl methylase/3-demethylubiquinone-9 3-methyltransferase